MANTVTLVELVAGNRDVLSIVVHFLDFYDWKAFSSVNKCSANSEIRYWLFAQCVLRLPPMDNPAFQVLARIDLMLVAFITEVSIPKADLQWLQWLKYASNIKKVRFWTDSRRKTSTNNSQTEKRRDKSMLQPLATLQDVNLSGMSLGADDFSILASSITLMSLDLSNTNVVDLHSLKGMHHLQSLSLANTPIVDISLVSKMHHLRVLDISGTHVQDFLPLQHLTQLQMLDLSRNWVFGELHLHGMLSLRELRMSKIGSMGTLEFSLHAPQLTACHMHDVMLDNFEFLRKLPSLTYLDLRRSPIRDFRPFASLVGLETLLTNCVPVGEGIDFLPPGRDWHQLLAGLLNLKELYLTPWDRGLYPVISIYHSNASLLLHCTSKIETLHTPSMIDYAPLVTVDHSLKQFRLIMFNTDDLQRLSTATTLPALQQLSLQLPSSPEIVDFSALESFRHHQLTHLEITNVLYEDLSPLKSFVQLVKLDLSLRSRKKRQLLRRHHRRQDFSFLKQLVKLEELVLTGRVDFSDVSVLTRDSKLRKLWLNITKVNKLTALSALPRLEFVHLAHTPITELSSLPGHRTLQTIYLCEHVNCEVLHNTVKFPRLRSIWHSEELNCLCMSHGDDN